VLRTIATPFGKIESLNICAKCNGYGKKDTRSCPSCAGNGQIPEDETFDVKINRRTFHGEILRMVGEGNPGREGGIPGDLFVTCRFRDSQYSEKSSEIKTVQKISFEDWLQNAPIQVNFPNNTNQTIQLPRRFQNGDSISFAGAGLFNQEREQFETFTIELRVVLPNISEDACKNIIEVMKIGSIDSEAGH
jgi:molecular chaperone DnaJ